MENEIKIKYKDGYIKISETKNPHDDNSVTVIKKDRLARRQFTVSNESFVKIISQLLVDSVDGESIKVSDLDSKEGTFHSTIVRRETFSSSKDITEDIRVINRKTESFEDFVERCNAVASSLLSQGYAVNSPEYINEKTAVINYWVEWRA